MKGAWVTLATNDSYSLGALVLAHSLKQVATTQDLAVLITPGVTNPMRARLSEVFNLVQEVNVLDSRDQANLRLLQRPELGITFTKLHCWRLTQYEKCVFLDADTLVLQNCDELFERDELSAAPDVGWPDCFNSGVFVYRPSVETYDSLIQFALAKGSFDGGDQGLLNLYFSDWAHKDISKHLPFIYNVCSTAFYSYLPAFKQFGKNVKILHFIGNAKPWLQYFDTETKKVRPSGDVGHLTLILQKWWDIFCHLVHPDLTSDMSGLAGAFAKLTLGQQRTPEQEALENSLRRQNWEQGNIDYLGRDSFDNIWSKICETLAKGPQEETTSEESKQAAKSEAQPKVERQQEQQREGKDIATTKEEENVISIETKPQEVSVPATEGSLSEKTESSQLSHNQPTSQVNPAANDEKIVTEEKTGVPIAFPLEKADTTQEVCKLSTSKPPSSDFQLDCSKTDSLPQVEELKEGPQEISEPQQQKQTSAAETQTVVTPSPQTPSQPGAETQVTQPTPIPASLRTEPASKKTQTVTTQMLSQFISAEAPLSEPELPLNTQVVATPQTAPIPPESTAKIVVSDPTAVLKKPEEKTPEAPKAPQNPESTQAVTPKSENKEKLCELPSPSKETSLAPVQTQPAPIPPESIAKVPASEPSPVPKKPEEIASATESSQSAQTDDVCPVVAPPRKGSGNKKQNKSKK